MKLRKKKKIVIALGAGGSRGLAHIGVIRALREADIPIDCIAGISFGSIIGSMYSLYLDIDDVQGRLEDYMRSPLFQETKHVMELPEPDKTRSFFEKIQSTIKKGYFYSRALRRKSFITPETFVLHMKELVGDSTFADLHIPFKCTSIDLITGNPIIFSEGNLFTALQASCATPGFFPPMRFHGMLLVDGGVAEMIPFYTAKTFNPDFIIGVDVTRSIDPIDEEQDIHHSLDVIFRCYDITREYMNVYAAKEMDCVIHPNIGSHSWADFDYFHLFIDEGYKAARQMVDEIRDKIYWF